MSGKTFGIYGMGSRDSFSFFALSFNPKPKHGKKVLELEF